MEKLLTTTEVAAILRVDEQTVRIWARTGRLKGTRVGRQWLFKREDVEALLNQPTEQAA